MSSKSLCMKCKHTVNASPASEPEPLRAEAFGVTAKKKNVINKHLRKVICKTNKIYCLVKKKKKSFHFSFFLFFFLHTVLYPTWRQFCFLHHHIWQSPGGAVLVPDSILLQAVQVAVVAVTAHQRHHTLQQAVQELPFLLQPAYSRQVVIPLHLKLCLQVTDLQFGCFQLLQQWRSMLFMRKLAKTHLLKTCHM